MGNDKSTVEDISWMKSQYGTSSDVLWSIGIKEGVPQYDRSQAEGLVDRMVQSKHDANTIGKIVGCHGYKAGDHKPAVYALDIEWNKPPLGHKSTTTQHFKSDLEKQAPILDGVHAKLAERQWLHHQMTVKGQSQNVGMKPKR